MITGFNTDVEHDGVVYHVQTEDKGLKTPLILSLVYVGGTILASKRTLYDDLIAAGFDENILIERLQRQHKLICAAIRAGRIEDLKRQTERDAVPRAAAAEGQKIEQSETAPDIAALDESDIFLHGNLADFMPPSVFMSPPAPPSQNEPAAPEVTQAEPFNPEWEHLDYSQVFDYSEDVASNMRELHIIMLDEKKFVAGEYVKIQLHIGRGWDGHRSVPNAAVTLKILGSSFRPMIFSGSTGEDGIVSFYAMLPYFTSGRAAILVNATDQGDKAELRRVIHQA